MKKKIDIVGDTERDAVAAAEVLVADKAGRIAIVVVLDEKALGGGMVDVGYCVHAEGHAPCSEGMRNVAKFLSDYAIRVCRSVFGEAGKEMGR